MKLFVLARLGTISVHCSLKYLTKSDSDPGADSAPQMAMQADSMMSIFLDVGKIQLYVAPAPTARGAALEI